MERLFRSRMEYIEGARDRGCFLCEAGQSGDDLSHLVVARRDGVFALLNKYPYNTGHVMLSPYRHVGDITELSQQEQAELMGLVIDSVSVLREQMRAEGFNIGANLGEVAGAGLPGHFHVHVVPRWAGDTNFMPVVGEAKVLPEALEETFARLKGAF
jgi:ATP adenylyltransferase